jgi:hypothetical protein
MIKPQPQISAPDYFRRRKKLRREGIGPADIKVGGLACAGCKLGGTPGGSKLEKFRRANRR